MAAKTKKKKSKKAKLTPSQLQDRRFKRDIDDIFGKAGFQPFSTDGVEITVCNRKGEIDHVFLYKNVFVVFERTTVTNVWGHLQKKLIFFGQINSD